MSRRFVIIFFLLGSLLIASAVSAAATYETEVTAGVNFRAEPSTGAYKFRLIPRGENIHVIGKVNKYWLKIKVQDGTLGYISSKTNYTNYKGTQPASGGSKADNVVRLAEGYAGRVSYDYGTRNPDRLIFDCSSFTQFIYRKVGVELRWGTRDQKSQGTFVSKSNLRKGDLVFFDTIGSNNDAINHVGIYMGNGQFIHNTPSKDGIAINSLSSGWWSGHYVSSRRVL